MTNRTAHDKLNLVTDIPETPEQRAGRELRHLRVACGWSQEETARRMSVFGYGWHQTMIAKTEAGQRPLRLNEAADLAGLFGVPLAGLLGPPETPGQAAERALRLEAADRERAVRDARALYASTLARLKKITTANRREKLSHREDQEN